MSIGVLVIGVVLLVALALGGRRWLWRSLAPVQREELEEFSALTGLQVIRANGPRVVDALARSRLWRVVGVLLGLGAVVAFAVVHALREHELHVSLLVLLVVLVGHFAGAVTAELLTARNQTGEGVRTASMRPRRSDEYVGPWARRWPARLGLTGVAAAAVAVTAGDRDVWTVVAGLGALAAYVITAMATRYVLQRPQRVEDPDLHDADDAVRSRSLHAIAGAGVGIELWLGSLAVGAAVLALATRVDEQLGSALTFPVLLLTALALPIAGFVLGRRLARRPFQVGRRTPGAVMVGQASPR